VTGGDHPRGYIEAQHRGGFTQAMGDGSQIGLDVPTGEAGELRSLLGLRDAARGLLGAWPGGSRTRAELGRRYESHVAAFGPVNRLDGPAPGGLP